MILALSLLANPSGPSVQLQQLPKGEEFATLFDELDDGIFNSDGKLWAFQ